MIIEDPFVLAIVSFALSNLPEGPLAPTNYNQLRLELRKWSRMTTCSMSVLSRIRSGDAGPVLTLPAAVLLIGFCRTVAGTASQRLIPPPLIPGGGIRVGRPLHPRLRARLLGVHLHAAPYSPYSHLAPRRPLELPSRKAQGPRELHCSPGSHMFFASVGGALGAVGIVGATLEIIHNSTCT